jgi:hypothetical protein
VSRNVLDVSDVPLFQRFHTRFSPTLPVSYLDLISSGYQNLPFYPDLAPAFPCTRGSGRIRSRYESV